MRMKKIPLRRAWYGIVLLASLLPAIALTPWLSHQAKDLLLSRAMLNEKVFHTEMEIRLDEETMRLVSVLENKSDPIANIIQHSQGSTFIVDLLQKISRRDQEVTTTVVYNMQGDVVNTYHISGHTPTKLEISSPALAIPMHGRVFIGSPSRLVDGDFEFLIAVPLRVGNEKIVGVMVSTININDFWQRIRQLGDEHGSHIYLIDGHGALMNHVKGSRYQQGDLLTKQAVVRSLLAHKSIEETKLYQGFEGTEVFSIATEVRGLAWGLISEIPAQKIVHPIQSSLITLAVIVFLIHLFFGLVGLLITGRLLSPISELIRVMKAAAEGDYSQTVAESSYQELDELIDIFNDMEDKILQRERSLQKLNHAIEEMSECIIITDTDGIIEYVNPAFTRITGYAADEVIGKLPRILNSGNQDKAFYEKLWATILSGSAWTGRLVNRKKDGSFYPVLMSISGIYEDGNLTHYVAVQKDMSEFNTLEEQLRQAQKMEAIGTLVGGIAHDFNNMLAGISGNVYLAKRYAEENSPLFNKFENINVLVDKAADMIKQLLTFARKDRTDMQTLDLSEVASKVLKFMRASLPENIDLQTDICTDVLPIMGDETQIHQLLMNLINNARDALENKENPCIRVELRRVAVCDENIVQHPDYQACDYAHLSVRDNGMGIPEHQLKLLFEPFFTTKDEGKGTGLGLAMVYGSVQNHHGIITVESEVGEHTNFHVYIPLTDQENEFSAFKKKTVKNGNGELVLLVDDEKILRETMAGVLQALGYRVLQAEDGIHAIEIYKASIEPIQVALLDVVMPRCGGADLAISLRKLAPQLPIIFMTGYDKNTLSGDVLKLPYCKILSKPVDFELLSQSMQDLLYRSDD